MSDKTWAEYFWDGIQSGMTTREARKYADNREADDLRERSIADGPEGNWWHPPSR